MQIHMHGSCQLGDWWRFTDVCSPFWRLYGNADDGAVLETAIRQIPLLAGQVYLIPAWCRFSTHCLGAVRHNYIHFEAAIPAAQVRRYLPQPLQLPSTGTTTRLWRQWTAADTAAACFFRAAACPSALGEAIAELPPQARHQLGQPVDPRLAPAWELLDDPPPGLGVAGLARACGLGCDQFRRRFRQATGQTPARHLRERRITRAAESLLTTDRTIEDIAEHCGFANRFHLSRCFSDVLGCGPATYRRQHRQTPG